MHENTNLMTPQERRRILQQVTQQGDTVEVDLNYSPGCWAKFIPFKRVGEYKATVTHLTGDDSGFSLLKEGPSITDCIFRNDGSIERIKRINKSNQFSLDFDKSEKLTRFRESRSDIEDPNSFEAQYAAAVTKEALNKLLLEIKEKAEAQSA